MQSTVININATTCHCADLYICLPGLTFPLNLTYQCASFATVYFRGSINVPCKPICCGTTPLPPCDFLWIWYTVRQAMQPATTAKMTMRRSLSCLLQGIWVCGSIIFWPAGKIQCGIFGGWGFAEDQTCLFGARTAFDATQKWRHSAHTK